MTPQEYVKFEIDVSKQITELYQLISNARQEADKSKPPKRTRIATSDDIVCGNVIWHGRHIEYGGDYWHVVEEVLRPSDSFKAYCADDGCRYGLDGAYVED